MVHYAPRDLLPFAQRTGRWVVKEVHGQSCLYSTNLGSSIRFTSTGSSRIAVSVLNNGLDGFPQQMYAWRVDDGPWHRFPAQTITIPLPDDHHHLVELVTAGNTDLDQVWDGEQGFAVSGIDLTGRGQVIAAPNRPQVDFIGDSITAGCWVAGQHAAVDYRPESNYVGLSCDQVGIDGVRIAYSAAGVLRPGTGGVPPAGEFLTQIDRTTPWLPNRPSLVVVNLGANDRRFPASHFSQAYDDFIQQVQAVFSQSKILLLVPFSQNFRPVIAKIAQRHRLTLIETAGWCTNYTDGLHPNQAGAVTAARRLSQVLHHQLSEMGFEI